MPTTQSMSYESTLPNMDTPRATTRGLDGMNCEQAYESAANFGVITSIRSDGFLRQCPKNTLLSSTMSCPFYMLQYHRDRMLAAAKDFGLKGACNLLDGPEASSALKGILENHLASSYGDREYRHPLKVNTYAIINSHVDYH